MQSSLIFRTALFAIVAGAFACGEPADSDTSGETDFGVDEQIETEDDDTFCEPTDDGYDCPVDCTDVDDWPDQWNPHADDLIDEVNDRRQSGVVCGDELRPETDPLEYDEHLAEAARCHAQDMAENDFFAHEGSDGGFEVDRARQAGYESDFVGENLARGQDTAEDVADAWVESEGHCINLSHPPYRETGAAFVETDGVHYWVQLYGRSQ